MLACKQDDARLHDVSFYHWKTKFSLDSAGREYLSHLAVKDLYVRIFDVKWVAHEKEAFPFAVFKTSINDSIHQNIIPVIYITNESLLNAKDNEIAVLANRIVYKCRSLFSKHPHLFNMVKEVQFDCDWSELSQEKYFSLIKQIKIEFAKKNQPLDLSATIRLHQVKYQSITGVPPVERGVLMFYNMGKLEEETTANSILDIETAKKYMVGFENYPLELDLALPLFSWVVQFRQGKVVQLINEINTSELTLYKELEEVKANHFRVKESFYLGGNYLYKGDVLRVERVTEEALEASVDLASNHLINKDYKIIFYHLDPMIMKNYPVKELIKTIQ